MEQERSRQRAANVPKSAERTRAAEPVRDDYVTHVQSLVPVRGSDPYTFFGGCWAVVYEYIAGFWHFVDLAAFVAIWLVVTAFVQRRWGLRFGSEAVAVAFFVALMLSGYAFAGAREYHRPPPAYEEGHVGLGPMFRALLVPHRGGSFGGE